MKEQSIRSYSGIPALLLLIVLGAFAVYLFVMGARGEGVPNPGLLIAGLVVSGTESKRVLIRGVGPTLAGFGVGGALADPVLTVLRDSTTVAANDDWSEQANAGEIAMATQQAGGFPLASGSRDAALLITLPPGAYTVQLAGFNGTTGVGLIEAYELP